MNNQKKHIVPAFTIFEVTIVLAIMGVIVSMVAFSVQRLFNQMQVTEELHAELNNFYQVRSTLWYDCTTADSVIFKNNQILSYKQGNPIVYFLEDEVFYRSQQGVEQQLKVAVTRLSSNALEDGEEIVITFDWKGESMDWRFFNRPDLSESVNQYFDRRNG